MGWLVEAEPGCGEAGLEVVDWVWGSERLGPGTVAGTGVWVGDKVAGADWRLWWLGQFGVGCRGVRVVVSWSFFPSLPAGTPPGQGCPEGGAPQSGALGGQMAPHWDVHQCERSRVAGGGGVG